MKKTLTLFILVVLTLFTACSDSSLKEESAALSLSDAPTETAVAETKPLKNDPQDSEPLERMIVKEGDLRFETSDAQKTREAILNSVKQLDGYLSHDSSSNYRNRTEYTIEIRIPAQNFETLLEGVNLVATQIYSKNISALDVTEEFIDVQARIKAKKEIEQRYKDLLKKANSVEDVLKIEHELGILRADIESFEGRLKYLKNKTALSTLSITFYEKGESNTGFGQEVSSAFGYGWDNLLAFIIGIFYIWPFIILSIILVFIFRKIRKRIKQKS